MNLARQIELYLLDRAQWVPVSEICRRFEIRERQLRQDGRRPGLLDHCAVSSTRNRESGFIHHRYLETKDWLPIKHRLRRHAIAELRKVRTWDQGRRNTLKGLHHSLSERHSGQLILIP